MIIDLLFPPGDLPEIWVAMLPGLYYYTTPKIIGRNYYILYVKEWLVPNNPMAIKYFFEGIPQGYPIPWEAWIIPLTAWCSFILAIYAMMISIMSIMRRQWVEYDRLTFPLLATAA